MPIYIRDSGVWKEGKPYVKDAGTWKSAQAYVKSNGVWVPCVSIDVTPPPAPVMTLAVVDNRYINVNLSMPSATADLDLIRVLVSSTAFPGTPFSTGYITQADSNSYPDEPWSDWHYADGTRISTTTVTTKTYPQNVTSTTQLTGDRYYYFSAWAKDTSGNWSLVTQSRIWVAAVPNLPGPDTNPPGDGTYYPDPGSGDTGGTTTPGGSTGGSTGGDTGGSTGGSTGGTTTPTTPSTTDTRKTYTTTWNATWSRSWKVSLFAPMFFQDGGALPAGPWPDRGNQTVMIGFPQTTIVNALKGAEILKVEVRLHSRNMYFSTGNIRWKYHNSASVPGVPNSTFSNWWEHPGWANDTTKWVDITTHAATDWKAGLKAGLLIQGLNNTDRHYAITVAGHNLSIPPAIRITYKK